MESEMKKILTIISLAATLALVFAGTAKSADKELPTAFIGDMSGKVEIWLNGDDDWRKAEKGLVLEKGDKIKTGANSEAVLQWANGHKVKVYALCMLNIEELSSSGSSEKTSLNVESGKIFAKANKLKSDKSAFQVETPTAVAGVRGTQFMVEVSDDGASTVALLEGSLSIVTDAVEMVLEENMQISFDMDMSAPPQPEGLDPSLKNEMQSESKSLGSVSTSDASSSTSSEGTSITVDTQTIVEDVVEEAIQSQIEEIEPIIEEEAPVPPMPPDR